MVQYAGSPQARVLLHVENEVLQLHINLLALIVVVQVKGLALVHLQMEYLFLWLLHVGVLRGEALGKGGLVAVLLPHALAH